MVVAASKLLDESFHLQLEEEGGKLSDRQIRLDADDIKKLRGRKITEARARVGAGKTLINITPREWEAIQARAVSNNLLNRILNNADIDVVKQYSMPKNSRLMSSAKLSRARSMMRQGRTTQEIAEALNVSVSTLQRALE